MYRLQLFPPQRVGTCNPDFRHGITILEILLALVILGSCLAILGELSRTGLRSARTARDTTQAELLCESILAKVQLGIIKMESAFDVPIMASASTTDVVPDTNAVGSGGLGNILWKYSLEITEIDEYGLEEIAVTVRQNVPEEQRPVVCRLVRWMALEPEEDEESASQ